MNAPRASLIAVTAAVVCLLLPLPALAQSLKKWSNEQLAGEYACRWTDADSRKYDTESGLNWLNDLWPKQLILSPDGTWQAFESRGEFQIRFDEIQLKSAGWAGGVFARLARDQQSTTAIAVYLPGWCGSDPDVYLAIICEKPGQKLSNEKMLSRSLPDPRKYAYFTGFSFRR
jgi:hypothetical protein